MGKRKLIGAIPNTQTLVKTNRKSLNRTLSRNCVGAISGMLLGNFIFLPSWKQYINSLCRSFNEACTLLKASKRMKGRRNKLRRLLAQLCVNIQLLVFLISSYKNSNFAQDSYQYQYFDLTDWTKCCGLLSCHAQAQPKQQCLYKLITNHLLNLTPVPHHTGELDPHEVIST